MRALTWHGKHDVRVDTVDDPDDNSDADLVFHEAVYAATGNIVYAQLIDILAVAIYANRALATPPDAEGKKASLEVHKAILDAIAAHDSAAAVAASNRMLDSWLVEYQV